MERFGAVMATSVLRMRKPSVLNENISLNVDTFSLCSGWRRCFQAVSTANSGNNSALLFMYILLARLLYTGWDCPLLFRNTVNESHDMCPGFSQCVNRTTPLRTLHTESTTLIYSHAIHLVLSVFVCYLHKMNEWWRGHAKYFTVTFYTKICRASLMFIRTGSEYRIMRSFVNLCPSQNIIRRRKVGWAGHVACLEEMRNTKFWL
jgi:hypothetical protein